MKAGVKADLHGQAALVTGGTAGVGLATALALGRAGARCWLTHRMGTADLDELREAFASAGAPAPVFVLSDIGLSEDHDSLVAELRASVDAVDIFVSNAANALVVHELEDWTLRGLQQSVRGSVWPTVGLTLALRAAFGKPPRRVIAMSSDGMEHHAPGYDMIASTKAMLETAVRYLAHRLGPEGCQVNAIRSRGVKTRSLDAVFGEELYDWSRQYASDAWWVPASEVAGAALALCSGRLDAVTGQVLTVDRGTGFCDNLQRLYVEREALGDRLTVPDVVLPLDYASTALFEIDSRELEPHIPAELSPVCVRPGVGLVSITVIRVKEGGDHGAAGALPAYDEAVLCAHVEPDLSRGVPDMSILVLRFAASHLEALRANEQNHALRTHPLPIEIEVNPSGHELRISDTMGPIAELGCAHTHPVYREQPAILQVFTAAPDGVRTYDERFELRSFKHQRRAPVAQLHAHDFFGGIAVTRLRRPFMQWLCEPGAAITQIATTPARPLQGRP